MLHDTDANVQAMSMTVLSSVLALIEHFPPSDAQVFPQYIFKKVSHLINDPALIVRVAFTESIAILAETALRFLDICHAIKLYETVEEGPVEEETILSRHFQREEKTDHYSSVNTTTALIHNDYDKYLLELQEIVARWVISITTDISNYALPLKQALLKDITRLCHFFGHDGVMACILPQVLAFLNHRRDWQLCAALCQHLPSICAMIGRAATEQFVVPCVETALIDDEEKVISSALRCLGSLVEMGLITRRVLLGTRSKDKEKMFPGIIKKYSTLLVHPSDNIRYAASFFVAECCRSIRFPDDEVFLLPIIRPYLWYDIQRNRLQTSEGISSCLVPPSTKEDFVSGSHDGTCKVWETHQILDSAGELCSSLTYDGHSSANSTQRFRSRINDISIVENSHSVASGDSNGVVHVWRVDTFAKNYAAAVDYKGLSTKTSGVSGCTMLRKVDPCEGEILAVLHFNTSAASIVAFATHRGIHSWDLRCAFEPFYLDLRPEYGHITSMAVGNDRNWVVAGSNRGYLALWDVTTTAAYSMSSWHPYGSYHHSRYSRHLG
mmetsp:Transcript_19038/g.28519  ORF Transcript_19038/g.28519 Transcript_19038/m.28519 type:complete len:553 (-) Transcript_19038:258-1916(-)